MADKQTNAQKSEAAAHEAEIKAEDARRKAEAEERSPEERKADVAKSKADDARAEAEAQRVVEGETSEPTTAAEAKGYSAVLEPARAVGDHHAQKFSHTPENPQVAPGLDPDAEGKVKLTMVTSDTLAAGQPSVAYVHPEMVGDYLRAGWSRA